MEETFILDESIVLPDLSQMDEVKFYKYISKILGYELAQLTKPAYMPKFVKYWEDLKRYSTVSDDKRKSFKANLEKKYQKMSIFIDKYTQLLIICLIHFSIKKKYDICKVLMQILAVKFYMNVVHRQFPGGVFNPKIWNITTDRLSPRHLYRVKKGIPATLLYLSSETYKRFMPRLMNKPQSRIKDNDVVILVYSLRQRISQSVKAFAGQYYILFQKHKISVSSEEDARRDIDIISSKLAETIGTYKAVDKNAFHKSVNVTGLRKDLAKSILTDLGVVENIEQLQYIIIKLHRIQPLNSLCKGESERNKMIRKVIAEAEKSGEKSVKELIKKLLFSLKIGYKLKRIYSEQLIIFFMQYLTIFIRNRICF